MAASAEHPTVFDTGQQYLGTVYAKALLGAAGQTALPRVLEEFDALIELLDQLPRLDAVLSSPRVPHPHKETVLDRAFAGKMSDVLLRFLKVVSRHGRLNCLRAIHQAAHKQYNESQDRVVVRVVTATELDAASQQQIATKLKAALKKDVIMKTRVDQRLIGGVVIRIGDTVYDGSLANRLVRLREETVHNTAQTIRDAIQRFTHAD
jgi:F-type H+-transporting ATPase subunit delta